MLRTMLRRHRRIREFGLLAFWGFAWALNPLPAKAQLLNVSVNPCGSVAPSGTTVTNGIATLTMGEEICLNRNGYADDFVFTTDFDASKVAGLTISSITFTSPHSIGFYGPYGVVSELTSGLPPSDVDFGFTSAVTVNLAASNFVVGDQLTVYFAGQPNFASTPFVIGTMTASVGGSSLSTPVILPTPESPDWILWASGFGLLGGQCLVAKIARMRRLRLSAA